MSRDNLGGSATGLSRDLVEHRLPIKAGFRPYKQPVRRFNPIIYDRIKTEINRLLDAGFIRSCRYADWISNIVPVEKKDSGKIRVCIDFRDLNKATPKDEYPMPIADIMSLVFLIVTPVTIKYLWLKKIYLKWHLDVRDLSAYLSGCYDFWFEKCGCYLSKSYEFNLP